MHEKTFGDTVSEIDEDRKIQMITRLLEKGGTMLATHHECGAPLFRYQGKVLCPVCSFQEKQDVRKQDVRKQEISKEEQEIRKQEIGKEKQEISKEARIKKEPEITRESETTKGAAEQREARPEIRSAEEPGTADYDQIATLTRNKVHSIAISLESETDLQRVKEKMECIELGIKILKLIQG